mmetsp:Transcript_50639/g.151440  ORF Transcript_50639/g.151440 Transcript_50639/m.151440 type:complete len:312 (-) Transcript_50639:575-1510(-)
MHPAGAGRAPRRLWTLESASPNASQRRHFPRGRPRHTSIWGWPVRRVRGPWCCRGEVVAAWGWVRDVSRLERPAAAGIRPRGAADVHRHVLDDVVARRALAQDLLHLVVELIPLPLSGRVHRAVQRHVLRGRPVASQALGPNEQLLGLLGQFPELLDRILQPHHVPRFGLVLDAILDAGRRLGEIHLVLPDLPLQLLYGGERVGLLHLRPDVDPDLGEALGGPVADLGGLVPENPPEVLCLRFVLVREAHAVIEFLQILMSLLQRGIIGLLLLPNEVNHLFHLIELGPVGLPPVHVSDGALQTLELHLLRQ